jgi:hypothetical protein
VLTLLDWHLNLRYAKDLNSWVTAGSHIMLVGRVILSVFDTIRVENCVSVMHTVYGLENIIDTIGALRNVSKRLERYTLHEQENITEDGDERTRSRS